MIEDKSNTEYYICWYLLSNFFAVTFAEDPSFVVRRHGNIISVEYSELCVVHILQKKTMVSLFLLALQLLPVLTVAVGSIISMPNCVDRCGDVRIPYPFGIGANCYRERPYEIICNASSGSPKPILREFNLEVLDINWQDRYSAQDPRSTKSEDIGHTITVTLPRLNFCGSDGVKIIRSHDFTGSPYRYSQSSNVLMMEGCGGSAELRKWNGKILAGCASICDSDASNMTTSGTVCYGVGCCQASIALNPGPGTNYDVWKEGLDNYEIRVVFEQPIIYDSCNASVAFIDSNSMEKLVMSSSTMEYFPTTLMWKATYLKRFLVESYASFNCSDQMCWCEYPYEGNPYIPNGCQVEDCTECHINVPYLGFFSGLGFVLLVLGSYWVYRLRKRRIEIERKMDHFKRNGGLLLQQKMSSDDGTVETTRVFAVTELEKATDKFNENRILGQGGQGTVYKGMLTDGKIVAIKKATKVDESQVGQFVNEVLILSQINHRNVVKLLGCCLETEVPILVYEFIPNGTLYEHLHGPSEDFHISWKTRLQIAVESAGAVAYLHSSSCAPIYHRDIKSTNILLDEKYRAKVSDFGTSKAINIEQTHVTTVVLGTYGYLDPEYFLSNQFTEKSDVYSFGVVLVELITGKKPICPTGDGGWINLATEFLTEMEDSNLCSMVDARIIDEGKEDEFMAVAELAKKCLNSEGKQRPTMKEIAVQLDGIRSSQTLRPAESNNAPIEVVYSDSGRICEGVFFADDDLPVFSFEIEPRS